MEDKNVETMEETKMSKKDKFEVGLIFAICFLAFATICVLAFFDMKNNKNNQMFVDAQSEDIYEYPVTNVLVELESFDDNKYVKYENDVFSYIEKDSSNNAIESIKKDTNVNVTFEYDANDEPYLEIIEYGYYDNEFVKTRTEYLFHLN